ncbi:MAG TPA: tetratricopeptide repeat protein [Bryobacteraceae bacterium]|nr:tetratricopeptide repeat protein [Bryobacteraceae bacterium]
MPRSILDLFVTVLILLLYFNAGARADDPSQEELRYLSSAMPLIQTRAWSDAEAKLNDGLKRFPHSAILTNALGIVYEREDRRDDAIHAFERALEWLPSFTAAQIHLASLYAATGKCDRAIGLFSAAVQNTSDAGALEAAGIGLGQCKDYADAVHVLEKLRTLNPASSAALFDLALAHYKNAEFQAALHDLESLPSGPGHERPDVLFLRGKILQALKRPGSAASLSGACQAQPEEDYCDDAAIELLREEHFLEAADLLQNSAGRMHASVTLLTTLGLAQFRLGRYHDAIATYSKALQIDPKLDAPREGLGFLLYMTGDLERARSVVEQGLDRPEADFYLPYLRALILYRTSRQLWHDALASLTRALQRNPKFAPSYFLRGKIQFEENNLDAALVDFQTAARLDPKYPLPYYKMAQIFLREGKRNAAEEAQRRFAALGNLREEEMLAKQTQDLLMPAER